MRKYATILPSLLAIAALSLHPAHAQTRNTADIVTDLEALVIELRASVSAPEPAPVVAVKVPAGGDLQAALDAGGLIELEAGAVYEGHFIGRSNTTLRGSGAILRGSTGNGLYVPPGVTDFAVEGLGPEPERAIIVETGHLTKIRIGDNTAATQSTAAQAPQRIRFRNVIARGQGRRGFEVNGAYVELIDCATYDVWDPAGSDSQGVAILNSPGPVLVDGGEYSAGSENLMVGGDTIKIAGAVQADVTIRRARFFRPLSWRTDGIARKVKNLIELKAGVRVKIADCLLEGSWKDGQDGYAFVITPRNELWIDDVQIDRVIVRDVSAAFQLLGKDYATVTPQATRGVIVRDSRFEVSRLTFGGRGILALATSGVQDVTFERIAFQGDGNALFHFDSTVMQGPFTLRDSLATVGIYGIVANGSMYGNPSATLLPSVIEGNTLTGARSYFVANFPNNTYVDAATFAGLVAE